jgi:hypothetical protein
MIYEENQVEQRRTNSGQFQSARALAERIEEMTRERQQAQTRILEEHTQKLADVQTTLSLLVERTQDLPDLVKRVGVLERWKAFVGGIAAVCTIAGGSVGWFVGFILNGAKK